MDQLQVSALRAWAVTPPIAVKALLKQLKLQEMSLAFRRLSNRSQAGSQNSIIVS
jgi:hypothetical protein